MMSEYKKNHPGKRHPFQNGGFRRQLNKPEHLNYETNSSTDVGVQATPFTVVTDDEPQTLTSYDNSDDQSVKTSLTKEKTPMCLVNELVRYNKVPHKYVLVDEQGPAHKKEFFIKLELGSESFQASGSSIKRAQHAAAEKALHETQLRRPTPRVTTKQLQPEPQREKKKVDVTPTVELNSLAMKMGIQVEYSNVDSSPKLPYFAPLIFPYGDPYHRIPSPYHSVRFMHPLPGRASRPFCQVLLKIGQHEFRGDGSTRQHARHNAASKALRVIKSNAFRLTSTTTENQPATHGVNDDEARVDDSEEEGVDSLGGLPGVDSAEMETNRELTGDDANKSEISLVLEIALKHNKQVSFVVTDESGPPHMRNFVTRCECGEFVTEGDGNSKKSSKKKAAKLMLDKLLELHADCSNVSVASTTNSKCKVKNIANKKKNRNLIKMQKANVDYGSGIHPISRLIQIQQANKKKDPVYTLVTEHGVPRRREFIIQVECNDIKCQGRGPNKKLAKRNAAEEMLQTMGYSKPSPAPSKSALKSPDHNGSQSSNNKHVTFSDHYQSGKVPGVIVRGETQSSKGTEHSVQCQPEVVRMIAQELLGAGNSKTAKTILKDDAGPLVPITSSKEQLEFLAKCMGVSLEFTNFPKGTNTKSCLSLVAIQTVPPQVFHGNAPTSEESNEQAALQALRTFAKDNEQPSLGLSTKSAASNGAPSLKADTGGSEVVKKETKASNNQMLNGHAGEQCGAGDGS